MNTNKAAYWIALGVLALGLNSEYRQGRFEALHRVVGHADSVMCRLSTRAARTLAAASMLEDRQEFAVDSARATVDFDEMARAQMAAEDARVVVRDQVRAQADAIRAALNVQRAEIRQVRLAAVSQARMAVRQRVVLCPKKTVEVVVKNVTVSDDDSTD